MATPDLNELVDRLRDHIIGALHVGELESGQPLPSIRDVARRMGADQRKVARAYRILETEGLVEIRDRSGVYAAEQGRLAGGLFEETAEWLAEVLVDAWKRRIPLPRFPNLVRRCVRPLRCAFVDSCTDAIEAFVYELREEFGFRVTPVWLHTLQRDGGNRPRTGTRLPGALRDVDLILTTMFSATAVRTLTRSMGKHTITVSVHPQAVATVVSQLERGTLTVVCVDPTFGDRIRLQYGEHIRNPDELRIVLAEDEEAISRLDRKQPLLLTRAARQRLGDLNLKLVIPHSPTLSPKSAHEITTFLIRMNSQPSGRVD